MSWDYQQWNYERCAPFGETEHDEYLHNVDYNNYDPCFNTYVPDWHNQQSYYYQNIQPEQSSMFQQPGDFCQPEQEYCEQSPWFQETDLEQMTWPNQDDQLSKQMEEMTAMMKVMMARMETLEAIYKSSESQLAQQASSSYEDLEEFPYQPKEEAQDKAPVAAEPTEEEQPYVPPPPYVPPIPFPQRLVKAKLDKQVGICYSVEMIDMSAQHVKLPKKETDPLKLALTSTVNEDIGGKAEEYVAIANDDSSESEKPETENYDEKPLEAQEVLAHDANHPITPWPRDPIPYVGNDVIDFVFPTFLTDFFPAGFYGGIDVVLGEHLGGEAPMKSYNPQLNRDEPSTCIKAAVHCSPRPIRAMKHGLKRFPFDTG